MLQCHIKGVKNGYPFKIEAQTIENREADYDPDFLRHIFPRIQWDAFREAAVAMGKSISHSKDHNSAKQLSPKNKQHTHSFFKNDNNNMCTGLNPLPEEVTEEMLQEDEAFLKSFHHALLEVHLEEGALICPETGRRFKVDKGIPNLLLHEDEI